MPSFDAFTSRLRQLADAARVRTAHAPNSLQYDLSRSATFFRSPRQNNLGLHGLSRYSTCHHPHKPMKATERSHKHVYRLRRKAHKTTLPHTQSITIRTMTRSGMWLEAKGSQAPTHPLTYTQTGSHTHTYSNPGTHIVIKTRPRPQSQRTKTPHPH